MCVRIEVFITDKITAIITQYFVFPFITMLIKVSASFSSLALTTFNGENHIINSGYIKNR